MNRLIILIFISLNIYAYNRLRNDTGVNVFWGGDTVSIIYNMNYHNQIYPAIKAWEDPDSYLVFNTQGIMPDPSYPQVVFLDSLDNKNSIKIVNEASEVRCYNNPIEGSGCTGEALFPSPDYDSVIAYTSIYTDMNNNQPGRIIDADIVVALDRFTAPLSLHHLQEVLVHEMGHFIGLDHYCEYDADRIYGIPACPSDIEIYPMLAPVMIYKPLNPARVNITDNDRAGLLSIYRFDPKRTRNRMGCGFLGSIDSSQNSSQGGFGLFILSIPLMLLFFLKRVLVFARIPRK